ncbi:MAG: ROK family protein [Chloroflexales bacterium]
MEPWLCGVDFGGSKLAVGLVSGDGRLKDKIVVYDHIGRTEQQVVAYTAEIIWTLLRQNHLDISQVEGIGVGFAGHVSHSEGIIITTSNMHGFKTFALRDALQERIPLRVSVDNDANAQAYAEFTYGAGRGHNDMIFMTVSTGVGGGIIINRKLYRGVAGTAGEFGHMIINPGLPVQCGCGNYGCLMASASGLMLPKVVEHYLAQGISTHLESSQLATIDGHLLKAGAAAGDELCMRVIDVYARAIGVGVYNLFQIFNPPIIILGGGLMNLGEAFFAQIKAVYRSLLKDMEYVSMEIVRSELGEDAGVIGAAALILEATS